MQSLRKILAGIQRHLFAKRTIREIYFKLFPHLNDEADHGYPFTDRYGLLEAQLADLIAMRGMLAKLEQTSRQMPEAEGEAFFYLALRDLNERAAMHLQFAQERTCPSEIAPLPAAFAA